MKKMTEIGKGLYVQTEQVKFVVDMERRSATSLRIRKNSALDGKLYYNSTKMASRCFVVMEDNVVYYTAFNAKTVADKLTESGKKLLSVDSEVFISVQHINALLDMRVSRLVDTTAENKNAGSELQFLRKGEKKLTELIMKTGEKVRLSKLAEVCINEINEE